MSDLTLYPVAFTQDHSPAEKGVSWAQLLKQYPLAMGSPPALDFRTLWVIWWVIFPFLFLLVSKVTGKEWIREEYGAAALFVSVLMLGFVYQVFWWYIGYCVVIALLWWWIADRLGPRL
jgi:hypothetical protein